MADLTFNGATWAPNVLQLEATDVALGGPGAIMNAQAQALGNMAMWLKGQVDALVGSVAAIQPIPPLRQALLGAAVIASLGTPGYLVGGALGILGRNIAPQATAISGGDLGGQPASAALGGSAYAIGDLGTSASWHSAQSGAACVGAAWLGLDFGAIPRALRRIILRNSSDVWRGCASVAVEWAATPSGPWTRVATYTGLPAAPSTLAHLELPPDASARRCWRVLAMAAPASGGQWTIGELEASDDALGFTDLATSAQAISGGALAGSTAGAAFDNSATALLANAWASSQLGAAANGVAWVGQNFGAARHIRTITLTNYTAAPHGCASVTVRRSSDGSAWTNVGTYTCLTGQGAVTVLQLPASGASQYWSLLAAAAPETAGEAWILSEVEMSEDVLPDASQVAIRGPLVATFATGPSAANQPTDASLSRAASPGPCWGFFPASSTRHLYIERLTPTTCQFGHVAAAPIAAPRPPLSGSTLSVDGTTLTGATTAGPGTLAAAGTITASSYGTAVNGQYLGPSAWWDVGSQAADFTATARLGWTNTANAEMGRLHLDVLDASGTLLASVGLRDGSNASAATTCEAFLGTGGAQLDGLATPGATTTPGNTIDADVTISRVGANWTFTGPGSLNYTVAGPTTPVARVRVRIEAYGISGAPSPASRAEVDSLSVVASSTFVNNDQHWFDVLTGRMMVWSGGAWVQSAPRLFVGQVLANAAGQPIELRPAAIAQARPTPGAVVQAAGVTTTATSPTAVGTPSWLHTTGGRLEVQAAGTVTHNVVGGVTVALLVNGITVATQTVQCATANAAHTVSLLADLDLPPGRHRLQWALAGTGGNTAQLVNARAQAWEYTG